MKRYMDLVRNIFTGVLSDVPPDFIPVGTIIDEPDTPREDTPIKTYDSVESIATVKVDKTTLARIMPVRISIDELHDFLQKVPTDAVWEVQWNEECTNHYLIAENDNGGLTFTPVEGPVTSGYKLVFDFPLK